MMQQGLAAQGAEPVQGGVQDQLLQQVVQALMQGASPDDLLQQGVPKEIIIQAIQVIQQQMAQQQGEQQAQGLAGMQA